MSCEALDDGEVVSVDLLVSVLDTRPPTIDSASVPANVTIEATSPAGAPYVFATPNATDEFGVDTDVEVACSPASGSTFPLSAPQPTTVTCTATDDSFNQDFASFDVTVQDTSAPTISGISPPLFDQNEPFVLADDASSFQLFWGPFNVEDADAAPTVFCSVGTLDPALSDVPNGLYVFVHDFTVGTTTVECTATDSGNNSAMGSFVVTIIDDTPPVITLNGDTTITIESGPGPYVDAGATAEDNADGPIGVTIDASAVDTTAAGTYTVYISATDSSGNTTEITRTVIVEFMYAGFTGIDPRKTVVNRGSSDPLLWAWLNANGSAVNSSGDMQMLQIKECSSGVIVLQMAGDPGASGFRYKANNYWQFNWETDVPPGDYCAIVQSSLTGQVQVSPPITVR